MSRHLSHYTIDDICFLIKKIVKIVCSFWKLSNNSFGLTLYTRVPLPTSTPGSSCTKALEGPFKNRVFIWVFAKPLRVWGGLWGPVDRVAMRPRLGMHLACRIPAGSRQPIRSLHSRFFNRPDFSCKSANVSFTHCGWPFKEHKSAAELNAFYRYDFWPKPVWLVKYISTRTLCLRTSCPQLLGTHHFWLCMEENQVCLTE